MSVLLDVVIGLLLIFLVFSIVVSGISEWFAQACGRRGFFLRLGMQRLIDDESVFRRVLHHPLVGSLYRQRAAQGRPPSYVSPNNFALALADVLLARAGSNAEGNPSNRLTVASLRDALAAPALKSSPVSVSLLPILDRAGDNLENAMNGVEAWFNGAMDRVGGWYKARTQKMLFVIGLVVAALCNVDSIEIIAALNRSTALRVSLVKVAESTVASGKIGEVKIGDLKERAPTAEEWKSLLPVLDQLRSSGEAGLPIGYACLGVTFATGNVNSKAEQAGTKAELVGPWRACLEEFSNTSANRSISNGIAKLAGWLITALAGTLGATYWFGLLSKAIDIRGGGKKPAGQEK